MHKKFMRFLKSKKITAIDLVVEYGGTPQNIYCLYSPGHTPKDETLRRIAKAMTNLGSPTTANEIREYMQEEEVV